MKEKQKKDLPKLQEVDNIIDKILAEQEEEEENITCCGDEITGEVADIGLCPTCKEHI